MQIMLPIQNFEIFIFFACFLIVSSTVVVNIPIVKGTICFQERLLCMITNDGHNNKVMMTKIAHHKHIFHLMAKY